MTIPQPMQSLYVDHSGFVRFRENAIVRTLLDHSTAQGFGLNELAGMDFTNEDRQQFAQLIGYSLVGYGELSYVSTPAYAAAVRRSADL